MAKARAKGKQQGADQSLVELGAAVTLIVARDDLPSAHIATLVGIEPLRFQLQENPELRAGDRMVAICQRGTKTSKTIAQVVWSRKSGAHWTLEVLHTGWVRSDRRRSKRIIAEAPGSLRTVCEGETGMQIKSLEGRFTDLSLTGGWFETVESAPRGTLVNWRVELGDKLSASGLALVARSRPKPAGVGLAFVDYFGDSEEALKAKLGEAA